MSDVAQNARPGVAFAARLAGDVAIDQGIVPQLGARGKVSQAMPRSRRRSVSITGARRALAFMRPQQAARDDMALDFRGAVPDALDPGVAPEALDGQFLHQPHAA